MIIISLKIGIIAFSVMIIAIFITIEGQTSYATEAPLVTTTNKATTNSPDKIATNDTVGTKNKVIPSKKILGEQTVIPNRGDMEAEQEPPKVKEPPKIVHVRVQVDSIDVYQDRDGPTRGNGEWNLYGVVTCCGGSENSPTPSKSYSFKVPGQPEGIVDTPSNAMEDVTGTYSGMWGTVEKVKFTNLILDFDVDNTNPYSEIRVDFFGIEDDYIDPKEFPSIPDQIVASGNPYAIGAVGAYEFVKWAAGLKKGDMLGSVQLSFNKAENYGVGSHSGTSDRIYKNVVWNNENCDKRNGLKAIGGIGRYGTTTHVLDPNCFKKDWPDFPEYIINFRITDKDYRCASGYTYNYATNVCKPIVIR